FGPLSTTDLATTWGGWMASRHKAKNLLVGLSIVYTHVLASFLYECTNIQNRKQFSENEEHYCCTHTKFVYFYVPLKFLKTPKVLGLLFIIGKIIEYHFFSFVKVRVGRSTGMHTCILGDDKGKYRRELPSNFFRLASSNCFI
ncbi:hypothetical protein ACJX0J_036634, partial [Zea mays]